MGLQGPEGPYLWPLAGSPIILWVRVGVSLSRDYITLATNGASDYPGLLGCVVFFVQNDHTLATYWALNVPGSP